MNIVSFKHKGLELFHINKSLEGIQAEHKSRLENILNALKNEINLYMVTTNYPNFRLHRLQGKLSKYHSIVVDRNWRLIFKYTDEGIELIDYVDYH